MPTPQQLQNVFNNHLGLRVGTNTNGAAYSMEDFGMDDNAPMDVLKWVFNPNSNLARAQLWEDHLYNTIWKIFDLTAPPFNLMIVSNAPYSGKHAEKYHALNGRGDNYTFRKCNHLTQNSAIIAQRAVTAQDTVLTVFNWVMASI